MDRAQLAATYQEIAIAAARAMGALAKNDKKDLYLAQARLEQLVQAADLALDGLLGEVL